MRRERGSRKGGRGRRDTRAMDGRRFTHAKRKESNGVHSDDDAVDKDDGNDERRASETERGEESGEDWRGIYRGNGGKMTQAKRTGK